MKINKFQIFVPRTRKGAVRLGRILDKWAEAACFISFPPEGVENHVLLAGDGEKWGQPAWQFALENCLALLEGHHAVR